ncbi:hypothetical protein ACF07V_29285 [Streptomyces sp. NPDC015661]|uniref:hypothetical protein n=1 Tax=Streptomyces sp. NPDC015661 TaxID=3364961 RepID=UPI0036FDF2DF
MDLKGRDGGRATTALGGAAAARRVDALFTAMASDFLLREQFITDPAQILAEYVRGERLEPGRAEDTNRLVYAVMSNPGLVRWIRDVARRPRHDRADSADVLADFGRAVVDNGASHVVTALVAGGAGVLDGPLVDVIADSGIFGTRASTEVSGTHMSTGGSGTDPLTESSGTHVSMSATEMSGTQMSTGGSGTDPLTESSGTHVSMSATEMSGTQMSTGGSGTDPLTESSGTHVSMSATEVSGTQMSTGGSGTDPLTESSGTHVSSGGAPALVALRALMRYSVELRENGLLDRPAGTR